MRKFFKAVFGLDRMLGLLALAALLALRVIDPFPVEFLRLKTFDYFQDLKPREIPPSERKPVTIVDLDEKSLAAVGQWPWARTTIAQMVHNLTQMGASLVAFDVVFAEPDRMNPEGVAEAIYGLDEETKAKLKSLPSNDDVLSQVIKQGRVVLGQAAFWEDREVKAGPPHVKSVATRWVGPPGQEVPLDRIVPNIPDIVRNVAVLEKTAAGHGMFSLTPEPDGVVRRVPSMFAYNQDIYPALSIEMLRVATGRKSILVEVAPIGVQAVRITKDLGVETDSSGRIWPYFSRHDRSKYVSAVDVLTGEVAPELVQGRMMVVGTSAAGLLDIRSIPTEKLIPGVEVHAQVIEVIANNAYLKRPAYALGAELSLLLVGGLLMIVLVPWVGAKWTVLLFLAVAGGSLYTSWYMFANQQMLIDAVFGSTSILLLYTLLTYTGYANEEKQRRQVRSAFSHYLSPAMVEKLADDPTKLKLGGETRNMTMLFCDVRGFTTISEQFDAAGLTSLINKLLTPLTRVILDRKGTVDKYMGDCIMAFWNAPLDDADHGRNACLSALSMLAEMEPLNARLEEEARQEGRKHIPLKVGIGLNSGDVVVGNMGSDQRFDYSILGDEVNLASRLEGQCKTYHVDITIGQNTETKVPDLATLELDLIKVKGKTEAVRIFALLGDQSTAQSQPFRNLKTAHDAMLAAYRAQDWATARKRIKDCKSLMGDFKLGEFYDLYEERIAEFEKNPPGADWDGVFVATSK